MTQHYLPARSALGMALLVCAAAAGILEPEWSRPLSSEVVSSTVRPRKDGTDDLFLLLADRTVLVVSRTDTLTVIGKAPAGTRAVAALPCACAGEAAAQVPCETKPSLLLVGPRLVAWNRTGTELWQMPAGPLAGCDSIAFIGWRDGRPRLLACGKTGLWVVTVGDRTLAVDTVAPGLRGCRAVVLDADADGTPEVCVTDGRRLRVDHPGENCRTDVSWPFALRPPSLAPIIAVADPDRRGRPHALVIAADTLRSIDPISGRQCWASAAGLPGVPLAVAGNGGPAYVTGIDSAGRCWLAVVKKEGLVESVLYPALPAGTLPIALAMLGDWPLLSTRTDYGAENVHTCSPCLAPRSFGSAGFSGARLRRVITARFDRDTFPDLVVVRTAGDVPLRLDLFSNRLGDFTRELAAAHADLEAAVAANDENAVKRSVRRIELVNAEVSPGQQTTEDERRLLDDLRHKARQRAARPWVIALGALLAGTSLLALLLLLLRRRPVGPTGQQVENKPLSVRVPLAADLVALDHNFVAKGNHAGAVARLADIRHRRGLELDRDLSRVKDDVEPYYSSLITRLIDGTSTINPRELVETAARRAVGNRPFQVVEMSRDKFRRELLAETPAPQPPGVRLILIRAYESPEIHTRLRWFSSSELVAGLEHFIIDHINYSREWAAIVLDYTVSTQWTRRSILMLFSDSPTGIDFETPHGHTASQLADIAASMRPAVEVPGPGFVPLTKSEKLWLRCHDYITVLEETRERLRGGQTGTEVNHKDTKSQREE